jgi:hypothetical protein
MNPLIKPAFLSALLVAMAGTASDLPAADFKLISKSLDYEDALYMPYVNGKHGFVQTAQFMKNLSPFKKVPQAISLHPLMGECGAESAGSKGIYFWLDESKGTGTGYDRLVLDANGNGDLTDDPILKKLPRSTPAGIPPQNEFAVFGPAALSSRTVGQWHPLVFAEVLLDHKRIITHPSAEECDYPGTMRIFPANYLATTVEGNDEQVALGIMEGDHDLQLGSITELNHHTSQDGAYTYYHLGSGSILLVDRNRSGQIEAKAFIPEAEPFSGMVYLGGKPCYLKLAKDFSSVRLDPYTNSLGRISLPLETTQIVLAHQLNNDEYEILTPEIRAGAVQVPTGKYRLASFQMGALAAQGKWVRAKTDEMVNQSFEVEAEKPYQLPYGLPLSLELKVLYSTSKEDEPPDMNEAINRLSGKNQAVFTELYLNAAITGKNQECYNDFEASFTKDLLLPGFTITSVTGKTLASGQFEYG